MRHLQSPGQQPWPWWTVTPGQLDVLDLDARQFLTVAVAALVAALRLELDDAELGATLVADDRGRDAHLRQVITIDDLSPLT